MRRWVAIANRPVVPARDNLPVMHQHRSNRHLARRGRQSRLRHRRLHESHFVLHSRHILTPHVYSSANIHFPAARATRSTSLLDNPPSAKHTNSSQNHRHFSNRGAAFRAAKRHRMELRRDPITQSWVAIGQRESLGEAPACPLDPDSVDQQPVILSYPPEGTWQVRVIPHPDPLYRVESEPARFAEGMYDKMAATGAHEVVIETRQHDKRMSQFSDEEIERVLSVWGARISDLKKDLRFKYVSIFKNQGALAGEEFSHAHSQITATIFVPRRIKYELVASHEWYKEKERCIFCDMVRQEEKSGKRIVDVQGDYYALCPYASRVPFEVWVMHRRHNHLFEQPRAGSNRRHLAALLGRVLRRLEKIAPAYHLVVHTSPNTRSKKGELAGYWKTLADDYHWHFEIMPIVESRSKSYSIKEVYFNAMLPEQAAETLRSLDSHS
jgi:UDPglucose--hexose-1-phosphate uridylyltransferase